MKKGLKLLGVAVLGLVALTGCTNSEMKKAYDKMQVSDDMNGYSIDCRISGTIDSKNVYYSARVENYMDKEYSITVFKDTTTKDELGQKLTVPTDVNYVYKDNKFYKQDNEKMEYSETDEAVPYTDTNVFLKGIINSNKVKKLDKETIGEKEYTVYEMNVSKSSINDMLKNTDAVSYSVNKDVYTKVWINADGYVYKIIYDLNEQDNLSLNVLFFGYNTSRESNIDLQLDTKKGL